MINIAWTFNKKAPFREIRDTVDIDETNATIIRILLQDSRTTLTKIAKICKITPAAVRMRILRLKEAGVIKNEITLVNPHSLGYKCIANLGIKAALENETELTQFLKEKYHGTIMFGKLPKYNIFAVVVMNNMQELAAIIDDLEAHPKVRRVETMIWAEAAYLEHMDNLTFAPESKSVIGEIASPRRVVSVDEFEIDEVDRQIAKILSASGRASFNTVAEQLGISTKQAIQRYNKLKGNVLTQSTVTLDLTKLGYVAFAFVYIRVVNRGKMGEIYSQLLQIPNMAVAIRLLGYYDLSVTVFVQSFGELFEATNKIQRIPGVEAFDTYVTRVWPEWPPNFFAPLLDLPRPPKEGNGRRNGHANGNRNHHPA